MVHNSELSWKRIKHPSQVVSVGQEIDVYIKELDPEKKRISLGYKTEEMDVFSVFAANHNEGDVVEAKIVSIMPFGAFAEVADGVGEMLRRRGEFSGAEREYRRALELVDEKSAGPVRAALSEVVSAGGGSKNGGTAGAPPRAPSAE